MKTEAVSVAASVHTFVITIQSSNALHWGRNPSFSAPVYMHKGKEGVRAGSGTDSTQSSCGSAERAVIPQHWN